MSSFGEHLRQQREMRGISLDEIVASTKIGRRLLIALEEEQFDLLPGGIFNKSYVRAYARCVGIDEEEAIAAYLEAAKETPPDTTLIAHQHAMYADHAPERAGVPLVPVLILFFIAMGAAAGWKLYQQRHQERANEIAGTSRSEAPAMNEGAAASASVPAATVSPSAQAPMPTERQAQAPAPITRASHQAAATAAPSNATTSAAAAFEVVIRPKDRAWVSVKADGEYVVRGIIKPPDVKVIRAANQVVFYTGNAGAVDVSFGGKNIPLAAGSNTEQTLVFTSRGVESKASDE